MTYGVDFERKSASLREAGPFDQNRSILVTPLKGRDDLGVSRMNNRKTILGDASEPKTSDRLQSHDPRSRRHAPPKRRRAGRKGLSEASLADEHGGARKGRDGGGAGLGCS